MLGDWGISSESKEHLRSCFDVLFHKDNTLYYRMYPKNQRPKVVKNPDSDIAIFSKGIRFHDPMEYFICREYNYGDLIHVIHTHDDETGEVCDVPENSHSITQEEFNKITKQ
jgi:hypothetical protein